MNDLFHQSRAPAPVVEQSTPTFRDVWGGAFRTPTITDQGIRCDEWCYIPGWDDAHPFTLKQTDRVFGGTPRKGFRSTVFGSTATYPATVGNLEILLSLPFVTDDTKLAAATLLHRWGHLLPHVCFMALGLRACTEPATDSPLHRTVMKRATKVVESVRSMTPSENFQFLMTGKRPNLHTVEVVTTSKLMEEANLFQQYSSRRLFSQQLIGAWAICHVKKIGLFYDMRVGKTDTAIVAARHAIEYLGDADLLIVVAPKNNLYDPWAPNLARLGFDVHILDGTDEEDEEAIRACAGRHARPTALVVNYERVGLRYHLMEEHLDFTRCSMTLDETSAIKNPGASRSKWAHTLTERAAYVVLLNGTPMEQGPHDLWSQLRCLDPQGVVTGSSYMDWCSAYLVEVAPGKYKVQSTPEIRRQFEMMLTTLSIRYIRSEADQFGGKDKNFRYIQIRPTKQMATQARNILNGFTETISGDGVKKYNSMSECILAVYGALRELSCGYDKYREDEDSKYMRVRHTIDPKLLWIRCFVEANPSEPLVVGVNFNEQEQALKEMLTEMGVTWSSTSPASRKITKHRLQKLVPLSVWEWMQARFGTEMIKGAWATVGTHLGQPLYELPIFLRYHEEIVQAVRDRFYYGTSWTEEYHTYQEQTYSSQEVADHRAAFNRGETHVYICKVKQMRGFSLSRVEAVEAGIGGYPTIVFTSPPWSLGDWDQAQDRCVGIDPKTKTNVCTMIYALVVPGMEKTIMGALRAKKEVQAELLKDAERDGYSSFVENLVTDMESAAAEGGDGFFDTDEMFARIQCGMPPAAKLTERNILNKMIERHGKRLGWKNRGDVLRWLQQEWPALQTSEEGVVLNPDVLIKDAWLTLSGMVKDD